MSAEVEGSLHALAEGAKLDLADSQCRDLLAFCETLLRWNSRINLTGARTLEALIAEHLPDSFAAAALVPPGSRVIDVGSGGGLPALPTALLRRDCRFTLVESRGKRAAFLRTAARELMLDVTVEQARIEDLRLATGAFDAASSRATFSPKEWLALGRSLVVPGGCVLVFTSPGALPSIGLEPPCGSLTLGGHTVLAFQR